MILKNCVALEMIMGAEEMSEASAGLFSLITCARIDVASNYSA